MKTDELINLLSTGVQPVKQRAAEKILGTAATAGTAFSMLLLLTLYGVRPDLREVSTSIAYWMKMGVPLASAMIGLFLLFTLAHPGKRPRLGYWMLAVPIIVLWGWALLTWGAADPGTKPALLLGTTWQVCIVNITFLALPVGAATLFALRNLAPTRPRLTGAVAGWFAGGVGASVYALHCPEMAAPFLAVWYVLGMLVPSFVMAFLAKHWLTW